MEYLIVMGWVTVNLNEPFDSGSCILFKTPLLRGVQMLSLLIA